MALPKQHRLKHSREFSAVYRHGRKAVSQHLVVRVLAPKTSQPTQDPSGRGGAASFQAVLDQSALEDLIKESTQEQPPQNKAQGQGKGLSSPQSCSRFGISISQKVSKRAVIRNRIKRQIRAAIRHLLPTIRSGLQVVVIVRPGSDVCEYGEFLRELEQLFSKLEVTNGRS
ncbi:MAG TPA: ribonuclease P protein component [Trichocoleus sp.]